MADPEKLILFALWLALIITRSRPLSRKTKLHESGRVDDVVRRNQDHTAYRRNIEADLLPNLKVRIAGFSFRRRAAMNLTHVRLNN